MQYQHLRQLKKKENALIRLATHFLRLEENPPAFHNGNERAFVCLLIIYHLRTNRTVLAPFFNVMYKDKL